MRANETRSFGEACAKAALSCGVKAMTSSLLNAASRVGPKTRDFSKPGGRSTSTPLSSNDICAVSRLTGWSFDTDWPEVTVGSASRKTRSASSWYTVLETSPNQPQPDRPVNIAAVNPTKIMSRLLTGLDSLQISRCEGTDHSIVRFHCGWKGYPVPKIAFSGASLCSFISVSMRSIRLTTFPFIPAS
jgi:hypothetical protein